MAEARTGAEGIGDEAMLEMFVIYENPADYPDKFVCRRWVVKSDGASVPDGHCWVAPTLAVARERVPPGCYRLDHQPGEDPCILETWL